MYILIYDKCYEESKSLKETRKLGNALRQEEELLLLKVVFFFLEKVTFEQKFEGGKRASHSLWGYLGKTHTN